MGGQLPKMAATRRECGERAKPPDRSHAESTGQARRILGGGGALLKVSTGREEGMEN